MFWIPAEAKFTALLEKAAAPDFAQQLDAAMQTIESHNPSLRGVLYREFSRLALEPGKLGELMAIVARLTFNPEDHGSRDVFGEVYEYFLGQFAMNEGQKAGEFYTPKSVVNMLVEILAPFKGKIYDPACGSGGMFVQSAKFKDAHQATLKKKGDLGSAYGSTFTNDQHKTLRADYILANPPYNISDWGGESLSDDPRWTFGIPPAGNANYAWLQHMWNRLSHRGRAGIVLANGSMSSNTNNEGTIRKNMVTADAVECMLALPGQLFSNTQIEFSQEDLERIAQLYHRWRGTDFSDGQPYQDEKGLCYSASLADIEKHDFVLTPGRYVGAADVEDDGIPFAEKMAGFTAKLSEQFAESDRLEAEIKKNLAGLGYDLS